MSVVTPAEPRISGAGPSRPPVRALESAAFRELAFTGALRQLRAEVGSSGAVAAAMNRPQRTGPGGTKQRVAMGMTQQYLAGELSVLLSHVQAVTTTEAARCAAWSLRHAAENEPVQALRGVTRRALALTEGLCWDSLNHGDMAAFTRQAAVCAELHEFGICAGLLKEG